jgi:hypothetical protein
MPPLPESELEQVIASTLDPRTPADPGDCATAIALALAARKGGVKSVVALDTVQALLVRAVDGLVASLEVAAASDAADAMGGALRAANWHRRKLSDAMGGAPLPPELSDSLYASCALCDGRHAAVLAAEREIRAAWRDGNLQAIDRAVTNALALSLSSGHDSLRAAAAALQERRPLLEEAKQTLLRAEKQLRSAGAAGATPAQLQEAEAALVIGENFPAVARSKRCKALRSAVVRTRPRSRVTNTDGMAQH